MKKKLWLLRKNTKKISIFRENIVKNFKFIMDTLAKNVT